jgi:hypothetical protein
VLALVGPVLGLDLATLRSAASIEVPLDLQVRADSSTRGGRSSADSQFRRWQGGQTHTFGRIRRSKPVETARTAGFVDQIGIKAARMADIVDRRGVKTIVWTDPSIEGGSSLRVRAVSSMETGRNGADGRLRRSKRTLTANPDGGTLLDPHHLDRREDWDVSHAQRTAIC